METKWKGDPAPAGLFAFGGTCFVLSCYTAGLAGVHQPVTDPVNAITGMALFYGGLLQVLVGVWEMVRHNTLSATIFTSYGAFWLSYAALLIPAFGVGAAYHALPERVFANCCGIFLVGWAIWTLLLAVASLRSPPGIVLLFLLALLTFGFLAASSFVGATRNPGLHRFAGFCGIITGICAVCNAFDSLLATMAPFSCWPRANSKSRPPKQEEESRDGAPVSSPVYSPV